MRNVYLMLTWKQAMFLRYLLMLEIGDTVENNLLIQLLYQKVCEAMGD